MTAPVHLAVSCCILRKLSHCWLWRLTRTTMTTLTDFVRDLCSSLTLLKLKCLFLVTTIQMGHCIWDKLTDYWSTTTNSTHISTVVLWNRTDTFTSFILCTLQTTTTRLTWQTKVLTGYGRYKICLKFWTTFSKFFSPSVHLTIDEVIVLYKGRVIFQQYTPKKHKCFGIKIYKICDKTGCTYDMMLYVGKDRQQTAQHLTTTYVTVSELTKKIQVCGHKLYINNFFSSSDLCSDLGMKHCQTQQEGDATGLRAEENDNQTWQPSSTD